MTAIDVMKLVSLLVTAPEPIPAPLARRLVDGAVSVLDEAIRVALDVCDALDNGTGSGVNLPELLREALTNVATELGGEDALVVHRPGSWEASHVQALGTVLR